MFDDGYFQVKGRCSDAMRFKVFGDVLYPAPIEEVLGKHPAIKECSVSLRFQQSRAWYGLSEVRAGFKEKKEVIEDQPTPCSHTETNLSGAKSISV